MTSYLITGATGTLGRLATQAVRTIDPAANITALARQNADTDTLIDSGVQGRRGDYDDPSSLRRACEAIDRVLLVSSPVLDPAIRTRHHLAVLDSASTAGVEHLVYTSALGSEHDPGHHRTEQALMQSPTNYTIPRNGLFTRTLVTRAWEEATTTGVVHSATPGHPLRTASVRDLACAAARALTTPYRGRRSPSTARNGRTTTLSTTFLGGSVAPSVSKPSTTTDWAHSGRFTPCSATECSPRHQRN